jgi:L-amino acid N-acyltransferase YncA
MMVEPKTPEQWDMCRKLILHGAGVAPSSDQRFLIWTAKDKPVLVVCFNAFFQKCCQIHVAMAPGYRHTPRQMLYETFRKPFEEWGIDVLLGVVSSKNEAAMRYDMHLGFRELARLPGVHSDGGDLVILEMWKRDCRFIEEKKAA